MFKDFAGIRIITDVNLVVQLGTREVERTWKERLLTRPWRPWQTTKKIANMVPDANFYMLAKPKNTVVMHPAMLNTIQIQEKIRNGGMRLY